MYKVLCYDNKYENYQYVETKTFQRIDTIKAHPKTLKLFANDIFDYDHTTQESILVHSNFKSNKMIPGILDLTMTHGKQNNKFLYLCKPDDKRIPFFLIPYQRHLGFDKSIQKIYITFQYYNWDHDRPRGIMTQNLGNIEELYCYYEYILYCKSLNVSIQTFTKETKQKLKNRSNEEIIDSISTKYQLEVRDKKEYYIFTMDSVHSNDYDDAFSYHEKERKLSIYISNVALIIDSLELWHAFSNRVSTIYLPDKKRTMLPNILIDCLCSLKEKNYKLCYVLDLFFDENRNIISHQFSCCKAYIAKNVGYENMDTFHHHEIILDQMKLNHAKQLTTKLMLLFNHYVARELRDKKQGIFKSLYQEEIENTQHIPQAIYERICILRNSVSQYCLYHDELVYQSQSHRNIDVYTQASSPIRRLIDLLNNIMIHEHLIHKPLSDKSKHFYHHWTAEKQLDEINIACRAIRKIQSKCHIYQKYEENRANHHDIKYKGYVFDKVYKPGDGKYQYMVYIQSLNLTTYITLLEDVENYSCHMFSLYVFLSEENDKKKIKLQLCYENKDLT